MTTLYFIVLPIGVFLAILASIQAWGFFERRLHVAQIRWMADKLRELERKYRSEPTSDEDEDDT